jgi:hypothetical protein
MCYVTQFLVKKNNDPYERFLQMYAKVKANH